MRSVGINTVFYGSTGKIMLSIANLAISKGNEVHTFSGSRKGNYPAYHKCFGTRFGSLVNRGLSAFSGFTDVGSFFGTRWLLKRLDEIQPDIIHLHNLHGWYLNLPVLFRFIKRNRIRVIWTLHDCWAFTAHCPHFTMAKCDKWKTGCHHCPQYRSYPGTYVDRTKTMWKLKKKWFTGVEDLTIVTPSQWLADLVKESFLKDYPVKVIHNGIDLNVFKPMPSNFREKYGIPKDKKILLGVAFGWGVRKGLDVFVELEKRLDPDKYQIVLVGTDEKVDKQLPAGIISIRRTQNQQALAEIYTAADLFVNPTREENYPTVNMESIACGTPVLTFRTGGSPEILDEKTGAVVDCDDIDALEREIIRICDENPYSMEACLIRAKSFDMNERFEEYIKLYER